MAFGDKMRNGWALAKTSFSLINENRSLLVFPLISGIVTIMIIGSFFGGTALIFGLENIFESGGEGLPILSYVLMFLFYLVSYGVVIFFNVALIHCAIKYMNDEPTSIGDGISFSLTKIDKIFSWAVISATVGLALNMAQDKAGKFGDIIIGLIGMAWSILTFFVIPVLVFEEKGVIDSVKESGAIMKKAWGESLSANFSFGLISFGAFLIVGLVGFVLFQVNIVLAIVTVLSMFLFISIVMSTVKTVFVAAAYQHVKGQPTGRFDGDVLDSVFMTK